MKSTRIMAYDLRYLKENVGIGTVLHVHGLDVNLQRRGQELRGPCPLHQGDNPTAFRVHLERGLWHCFTSCGGGDVVELVRRILHCNHAGAARHLRELLYQHAQTPPARGRAMVPTREPFRPFTFRIPLDPRLAFLQQLKGVAIATASSFEAGWNRHSIFLRGTAAVRLHDMQGSPLGYCGRRLDPHDVARWGKWRFPRFFPKSDNLFNAHRAARVRDRGIVVVEGPWAVLRLAQARVPGAVALLGSRISPCQARWLAQAPVVLLLLDGDRAGREATRDVAAALAGATVVRAYELPNGAEPEDLTDHELNSMVRQLLPL